MSSFSRRLTALFVVLSLLLGVVPTPLSELLPVAHAASAISFTDEELKLELPDDYHQLSWRVEDFDIVPQNEPVHYYVPPNAPDTKVRGAELRGFSARGKRKLQLAKIKYQYQSQYYQSVYENGRYVLRPNKNAVVLPLTFPRFVDENINPILIRKGAFSNREEQGYFNSFDYDNSDFRFEVDFANLNQLRYIDSYAFDYVRITGLENHPNLIAINKRAFFNLLDGSNFILRNMPNFEFMGVPIVQTQNLSSLALDQLIISNLPKLKYLNAPFGWNSSYFPTVDAAVKYVEISNLSLDDDHFRLYSLRNDSDGYGNYTTMPLNVEHFVLKDLPNITWFNGFSNSNRNGGYNYQNEDGTIPESLSGGNWYYDQITFENLPKVDEISLSNIYIGKNLFFKNVPEVKAIRNVRGLVQQFDVSMLANLETLSDIIYAVNYGKKAYSTLPNQTAPVFMMQPLTKLKTLSGIYGGYDVFTNLSESNKASLETIIGGFTLWNETLDLSDLPNLKSLTLRNSNHYSDYQSDYSQVYQKPDGAVPVTDVTRVNFGSFPTLGILSRKITTLRYPAPAGKNVKPDYSVADIYPNMNKLYWENNPDPAHPVIFAPSELGQKIGENAFATATTPIVIAYYNDADVVGGAGLSNIPFSKLDVAFADAQEKDIKLTPYYSDQGQNHKYPKNSALYLGNDLFNATIDTLPDTPTVYDYMKGKGGQYGKYASWLSKDGEGNVYLIVDAEGNAFLPFLARPKTADATGTAKMQYVASDFSVGTQGYTIPKRPDETEKPAVTVSQDAETGDAKLVLKKLYQQTFYANGSEVMLRTTDGQTFGQSPYTIALDDQGQSYITVRNADLAAGNLPVRVMVRETPGIYSEEADATLPPQKVQTPAPEVKQYTLLDGGTGMGKAVLLNSATHTAYPHPSQTEIYASIIDEHGHEGEKERIGTLNFDNSILVPAKFTANADTYVAGRKIAFYAKEPNKFVSLRGEPVDALLLQKTPTPPDVVLNRTDRDSGKITVPATYPANSRAFVYAPGGYSWQGFVTAEHIISLDGNQLFAQLNDPRFSYPKLKDGIKYAIMQEGMALSDEAAITEGVRPATAVAQPPSSTGTVQVKITKPAPTLGGYAQGSAVRLFLGGKWLDYTTDEQSTITIDRADVPVNGEEVTQATITEPGKETDTVSPFTILPSNVTKVNQVTITLDEETGRGVIFPTKPDGSPFPQGTFVYFPHYHPAEGFKEVYVLDAEGKAYIANIYMPIDPAGVDTRVQVREADKIYSDELPTNIPKGWDKTEVPTTIRVQPMAGYYQITLRKQNGAKYETGTVLRFGEDIAATILLDGSFVLQEEKLRAYSLGENATLTEPRHFASDRFAILEYTPDPKEILIIYDEEKKVAAFKPISMQDQFYPEGSLIHVTGGNVAGVMINNDGGTSYMQNIERAEVEKYLAPDVEGRIEEPRKLTSRRGAPFRMLTNEEVPLPIENHVVFANVVPIVEQLEHEGGIISPERMQIIGTVRHFDAEVMENPQVRILTHDGKLITQIPAPTGDFRFLSRDMEDAQLQQMMMQGFTLQFIFQDARHNHMPTVSEPERYQFAEITVTEPIPPEVLPPVVVPPDGGPGPILPPDPEPGKPDKPSVPEPNPPAPEEKPDTGKPETKPEEPQPPAEKPPTTPPTSGGGNVGGGGGGTVVYYLLDFETNGGSRIPPLTVTAHTQVDLQKYTPTRAGYRFVGWFADEKLTQEITRVQMTNNKIVYASWQKIPPVILNDVDHFAYIKGYHDDTVRPNANITRAEVAMIFYRLLKKDVREKNETTQNTFTDLKPSDWFNRAVSTVSKLGLVQGYADGSFLPEAPITRAEFAAILARLEAEDVQPHLSFKDIQGHWAAREMLKAAENGWITGYPDGTVRPNANITRAESVTMINRVLWRLPASVESLLTGMKLWKDNQNPKAWYYLALQEATNGHEFVRIGEKSHLERWTKLKHFPIDY